MSIEARASRGLFAALLGAIWLSLEPTAGAYCRTTTCDPKKQDCSASDSTGCPGTVGFAKLIWPERCVSYDMQVQASSQASLEVATPIVAAAFRTWESVNCGGAAPSISLTDLGPVACREHRYNEAAGNANIVMFRDDSWPYQNAFDTLALTTVTYNTTTGLIYDADMEINGTQPIGTGSDVTIGKYDLQSVVTHEAGHFLGFAHTQLPCFNHDCPTMYPTYDLGTGTFRTLSDDDVAMMCEVYAPNRSTPRVCDARPRHGFSSECSGESTKACFVSSIGRSSPRQTGTMLVATAGALFWTIRRGRHLASSPRKRSSKKRSRGPG